MARLERINRDCRIRYNYKKKELNFILFKYFNREFNMNNNYEFKCYLYYKFICWFKLTMSITKIRNFCLKTGRSRWILRRFMLSRITFKEFMRSGKLQGMRKL